MTQYQHQNFNEKIGISTNVMKNPENLTETLELLSENFKVVEIEFEQGIKNLLFYPLTELDKISSSLRGTAKNKNLVLSAHAPYLGTSADIAASDESVRKSAIDLMLKAMGVSHGFGIKLFTFHPGYLSNTDGNEILFRNLCRSLETMSICAEQLGITLSIENTGDKRPKYMVLSDQQHEKLYQLFNVKLTMDLIHYTSFNQPDNDGYYERLNQLLPYIANVHFADMNMPKHIHIPLGTGNFPYHKVLSFLYDNGYQGNFIIEETGGGYKPEHYIKNGVEYKNTLY